MRILGERSLVSILRVLVNIAYWCVLVTLVLLIAIVVLTITLQPKGVTLEVPARFDIDPSVAAQRLADARAADRFEAEQRDFFSRVRSAYLARAARYPQRFVVLDGAAEIESIRCDIAARLAPWIAS